MIDALWTMMSEECGSWGGGMMAASGLVIYDGGGGAVGPISSVAFGYSNSQNS